MKTKQKYQSTGDDLKARGFASVELNEDFKNKSFDELAELLKSKTAVERTLAARFSSKFKSEITAEYLISALKSENKLYTKIEICNSLVVCNEIAVPYLIENLGLIGKNQHKTIQKNDFLKKSYPLPRDICARTLIRIGEFAMGKLVEVLKSDNLIQISEAVDAIGFICFYSKNEKYFNDLKNCYFRFQDNELLKWKIVRAMSAFEEAKEFLAKISIDIENERIKSEIARSLNLNSI